MSTLKGPLIRLILTVTHILFGPLGVWVEEYCRDAGNVVTRTEENHSCPRTWAATAPNPKHPKS